MMDKGKVGDMDKFKEGQKDKTQGGRTAIKGR